MNLSFIQDKDVCGILILADREADNDNRWMIVLISADLSACHMGGGGVQAFRPYSKEMVVCVGWGGEGWDYESKSVHPSSPQQVVDSPSLMRVYG